MKHVVFYPSLETDYVVPETPVDYTINSAEIVGDILTINFSYNGNCGTQGFDLIFNGRYMKSMPMKINLYLEHTSSEKCADVVTQEMRYSLSEIMPNNQDKLIVKLHSWDENLVIEKKHQD
jgi:hypothetical protein